jgi:hypothetical protein
MLYRDYGLEWGGERAARLRSEVEHNRLETRLAKLAKARLAEEIRPAEENLRTTTSGRALVVRCAGAVMALFR